MSEQDKDKDSEKKPMKIEFAPGCFDDFEGTQEELDELVAHLTAMAESGELLEKSVPIEDLEDIDGIDEFMDEIVEKSIEADEKYGFDDDGFVRFPFNNTRH